MGPDTGFVSQNCVCKSCPPGALKQHRSVCLVVLWQLSTGFAHEGTEPAPTAFSIGGDRRSCVEPKASLATERMEGKKDVMLAVLDVVMEGARNGAKAA